MFEDATFESSNRIKSKSKYWMILTTILCGSVIGVMVLIPLIYPEALPKQAMATLLVAPPPPHPPPPPPPPEVHQVQVKPQMMNNQLMAPTKIPKQIKMVTEKEAPPSQGFGVAGMEGMGGSGAPGGVIGGLFGGSAAPVVKAAAPKKIAISQGVAQGMLVERVNPVYPAIAKAARMQGTVVLQATISKTGQIENLRVVSGPAMLQQSAIQAVSRWRYKPYLLNGEPVEVETTVNVVFSLNG